MKNISLRLPDDLHSRFVRVSKNRNTPESDVVWMAFESYLSKTNGTSNVSYKTAGSHMRGGDLRELVSAP